MSLAGQVTTLATRVATEFRTLRAEIAAAYVPTTARGPIGGVGTYTVGGSTFALNAGWQHMRWTLTGDVTVNPPGTAPADGQRVLVEALASGGTRTITFASGFELSAAAPSRTVAIPADTWAYIALIHRNGAMRIVSVDPVVPAISQAITYAGTITPDAATGSQFHIVATGSVAIAPPVNPTDGQRLMVEVVASGGTRTVSFTGATTVMTGLDTTLAVGTGKVAAAGLLYSARAGHWVVVSFNAEP